MFSCISHTSMFNSHMWPMATKTREEYVIIFTKFYPYSRGGDYISYVEKRVRIFWTTFQFCLPHVGQIPGISHTWLKSNNWLKKKIREIWDEADACSSNAIPHCSIPHPATYWELGFVVSFSMDLGGFFWKNHWWGHIPICVRTHVIFELSHFV